MVVSVLSCFSVKVRMVVLSERDQGSCVASISSGCACLVVSNGFCRSIAVLV